jgi:serpin B
MSENKIKLYREQYNKLTRQIFAEYALGDKKDNVVISPLSIIILMAIAADSTDGKTRKEISELLRGEMPESAALGIISLIQRELSGDGYLASSNATIINKSIYSAINPEYHEMLSSRYGGELFCSGDIVNELNAWVKKKTDGMIDKVADDSMKNMLAALVNAIVFQAGWLENYEDGQIHDDIFNNADGSKSKVKMLTGIEEHYIEDKYFTGFLKPYAKNTYSFMALLPKKTGNERVFKKTIEKINFSSLYESVCFRQVTTFIPEFTASFDTELSDFLRQMGVKDIFSGKGDFSPLASEQLKVESVIHKARIEVDRNGTKAAAVTFMIGAGGIPSFEEPKVVKLDRPFVYAVIHNKTGLPVFTGVTNTI